MNTSFTQNNKLNIKKYFIKEKRYTFHIEPCFQVNTHKPKLFETSKICNQDYKITVSLVFTRLEQNKVTLMFVMHWEQ